MKVVQGIEVSGRGIVDVSTVHTIVAVPDKFELARFGDRHLAIYRNKLSSELGPACATGLITPDQLVLQKDLQDWLDLVERCQAMLRLAPLLRNRYND